MSEEEIDYEIKKLYSERDKLNSAGMNANTVASKNSASTQLAENGKKIIALNNSLPGRPIMMTSRKRA